MHLPTKMVLSEEGCIESRLTVSWLGRGRLGDSATHSQPSEVHRSIVKFGIRQHDMTITNFDFLTVQPLTKGTTASTSPPRPSDQRVNGFKLIPPAEAAGSTVEANATVRTAVSMLVLAWLRWV